MDINTLFAVGNVLLLIASFPLVKTVWKNRSAPKDFNPLGSFMTFLGLSWFNAAYISMDSWWCVALNLPTVVFWGLASIYSIRQWARESPLFKVALPMWKMGLDEEE